MLVENFAGTVEGKRLVASGPDLEGLSIGHQVSDGSLENKF